MSRLWITLERETLSALIERDKELSEEVLASKQHVWRVRKCRLEMHDDVDALH